MDNKLSRRAFLSSAASAARGSCIVLSLPMILTACERAREARFRGEEFQTLSEEEANELAAIAARIIPTDDQPGANEAGVIYFMDNVLGDGRELQLQLIREGLRQLQTAGALAFEAPYFHVLEPAQQDQLLTEIEHTPFFNSVRYLTVAGMFALPEYGGNPAKLGNTLIGFEDRHAWQAPFGFYDANYSERGQ